MASVDRLTAGGADRRCPRSVPVRRCRGRRCSLGGDQTSGWGLAWSRRVLAYAPGWGSSGGGRRGGAARVVASEGPAQRAEPTFGRTWRAMSDLLERIHREIRERLAASRAAVEESARLEAALEALAGAQTSDGAAARSATPAPAGQSARRRAPRGANRGAVLAAVAERPGTSAGEIAASSGV